MPCTHMFIETQYIKCSRYYHQVVAFIFLFCFFIFTLFLGFFFFFFWFAISSWNFWLAHSICVFIVEWYWQNIYNVPLKYNKKPVWCLRIIDKQFSISVCIWSKTSQVDGFSLHRWVSKDRRKKSFFLLKSID